MFRIVLMLFCFVTLMLIPSFAHNFSHLGDNDYSSVLEAERLFFSLVTSCQFKNRTLIIDGDTHLFKSVNQQPLPSQGQVLFDTRNGERQMAGWIRRTYKETDSVYKDFTIHSKHPGKVLDQIDEVFKNDTSGALSGFPHKTRWLVHVWLPEQMEEVKEQQLRSSLDNVAVKPHHHLFRKLYTLTFSTFVWTKSRTRVQRNLPHLKRIEGIETQHQCPLFPNTKYGFNGRQLRVIVKPSLESSLHVEYNPILDRKEFKGVAFGAFLYLSLKMNFTYIMHISADAVGALSWEEFKKTVTNGTAAIGVTMFSTNVFSKQYNGSFDRSYPILHDPVTAIYRNPKSSGSFGVSLVVKYFTLFYLSSAIFTIALYLTIMRVIFPNQYDRENLNTGGEARGSALGCEIEKSQDSEERLIHLDISNGKWIRHFLHLFFIFVISLFSQCASMPQPRVLSARVLVSFWGVLIIITTSLFTSIWTAALARREGNAPYTAFEPLAESGLFRWQILSNSAIDELLRISNHKLMVKISNDLEILESLDVGQTVDERAKSVLESLPENTVFICYQSVLRKWITQQDNAMDYVLLEDTLYQNTNGFIFPAHSEMKELTLPHLISFHDFGFVDKSERSSNISDIDKNMKMKRKEEASTDGKNWLLMFKTLVMVAAGLAVSIATLSVEIATHKRRHKMKEKDTSSKGEEAGRVNNR